MHSHKEAPTVHFHIHAYTYNNMSTQIYKRTHTYIHTYMHSLPRAKSHSLPPNSRHMSPNFPPWSAWQPTPRITGVSHIHPHAHTYIHTYIHTVKNVQTYTLPGANSAGKSAIEKHSLSMFVCYWSTQIVEEHQALRFQKRTSRACVICVLDLAICALHTCNRYDVKHALHTCNRYDKKRDWHTFNIYDMIYIYIYIYIYNDIKRALRTCSIWQIVCLTHV